MSPLAFTFWFSLGVGAPAEPAAAGEPTQPAPEPARATSPDTLEPEVSPRATRRARLRRYLTRPVARSVYYQDHGVIGTSLGLGYPHIYRLALTVGVLDHLTLGATAHWLPGQTTPGWSPVISAAFFRGRVVEIGASYFQVLHPPPEPTLIFAADAAVAGPNFQRRSHYTVASASFSQAWFTAGFDLGWARGREPDPLPVTDASGNVRTYQVRDRMAAGIHARFGTRRIGLVLRGLYPYAMVDAALELRFGAFELRPKGGWRQL